MVLPQQDEIISNILSVTKYLIKLTIRFILNP
jgi:hypothetical protein